MKQLTYTEIERLQHILNTAMFELKDIPSDLVSLKNKLIAMRSQLESPKYYKDLTPEEVMNTI